uniref:FecR family protein n=1 Tax=Pedobacter schmidteae TaxID=2201271 RepID=UPI000EB56AE0|nr:FecR family protein [Pedobacter schmidteae]
MTKEQFQELIRKISDGEATDQEIGLYNRYYHLYQQAGESWDETEMGSQQVIGAKLQARIKQHLSPIAVIPLWRKTKTIAAAIAFVVLSSTLFFMLKKPTTYLNQISKNGADIAPGTNKAILTLSSGQKITVTDSLNGQLASENGITVSKTAEGLLVYKIAENVRKLSPEKYNTIETPKGGKYQIILPDGTKIWLNAASTLKYPASFSNYNERRVELSGEAYFEVTKNKAHPFIVKTERQEVEVLGTHFNVNSYKDEPDTKTTLLEGSVKVNALGIRTKIPAVVIKPGEQALASGNNIYVKTVDVTQAIDWKNDEFVFKNESLASIMRKVSRWYDVEVEFIGGKAAKETFSGSLSRQNTVSEVLKTLELTDRVHFEIDGRKIIVSN